MLTASEAEVVWAEEDMWEPSMSEAMISTFPPFLGHQETSQWLNQLLSDLNSLKMR
jgi:hypothetical protein